MLDIDLDWRLNTVSDGQRRRVQICMGLLKPYQVIAQGHPESPLSGRELLKKKPNNICPYMILMGVLSRPL